MEELLKNRQYKILMWIFIIISIVHVIYATITMRGMYEDGAFFMLNQLNNYSNHIFKIMVDPEHPRLFITGLIEFPSIFAYYILQVHNKYILMMLYSCASVILPLLALLWNYKLSKRTQRLDIFYWSLFNYSLILIIYLIYSIVESILGSMLHFILWNYLAGEINYNKKDIILITLLVMIMFGTYEYVIYLGVIFFIAAFIYAKREKNFKNKIIKYFIGIGALGASVYNLVFILNIPGEKNEIIRFFLEIYYRINDLINLNSSISLITLIILFIFIFRKKLIGTKTIIIIALINIANLIRLLITSQTSVNPIYEQTIRPIICFVIPIIFIVICLFDFFKKEQNYTKLINYICIVLICGIIHTVWQLNNTYWWDKNIRYLKQELNKTQDLLYIPSEHNDISSFFNSDLRRYIVHCYYTTISILFSDSYEQKTLLVNYDKSVEEYNPSVREKLYIPKNNPNTIFIPFNSVNIKNKFWDLTKCADALQKYDIEHNINQDK